MPAKTSSSKCITVSIVSHGQQALIVPLLEQLEAYCTASIDKIVLTTNVPEPDLSAGRRWRVPIDRIANAQARGFGANHNAAFERCASDWFLVLNPDIRLDCDVLGALRDSVRDADGVLTPRIMENGRGGPEPHRDLLTPCEILARRRTGYVPPKQPVWIPGMFMLFRSAAYRQIGGFDRRYFMYGEDFDICARLRLAGWKIHAAEQLQVQHHAQRASQRDWQHLRWHFTSLMKVWLSCAFWRYRAVHQRGA